MATVSPFGECFRWPINPNPRRRERETETPPINGRWSATIAASPGAYVLEH
jgi:hypothetical protein